LSKSSRFGAGLRPQRAVQASIDGAWDWPHPVMPARAGRRWPASSVDEKTCSRYAAFDGMNVKPCKRLVVLTRCDVHVTLGVSNTRNHTFTRLKPSRPTLSDIRQLSMTDYDFRTLNDKEFEVLATDLLTNRDGHKYERFKPGRDAGVDGRYFKPDGTEVILQCKHWPSSPLERLIKYVQDEELPKIRRLSPARYVLAISHPLSRNDKTRISSALSPYILEPADILGREDLNDLLSANSEVELKHYKLWITSTNVLRHLLNNAILDRSAFALQEIQENAHLYVPTANHDRALERLERLGTVIITGPAGIGKTTLADHLAFHYVAKEFSFIRIADEIREAEAAFLPNEPQLFFFDDFLGRNYLEALSGHEGTHIVQFIKRISRDKKKRFILTSRTTILNQGKILIDVFQNNNLERNEFEVSFESFSEIDKARILYNHIWNSSLEIDR
jgi:adenylate kinase family enzyme